MRTRYEATLNGRDLSTIDDSILIMDIANDASQTSKTVDDIAGHDGQRMKNKHVRRAGVVITFEIHSRDIRHRQEVCQKVQGWARGGGVLKTNDRIGQMILVECDEPPSIRSALKWTQALQIRFAAYDPPYWQDERARSVVIAGTSGEAALYVPGIADKTRVSARVKNTSSVTVNRLTLRAGATWMEFTGLALPAGETLVIDHDENGLLRIRVGEESRMQCRTAESSDELLCTCGEKNQMTISAGAKVEVTFETRGLYL